MIYYPHCTTLHPLVRAFLSLLIMVFMKSFWWGFFSKHSYENPPLFSLIPSSAKLKEKCFMINTAEISMFNLNRWAAQERERERASELQMNWQLWKLYTLFYFSYASTIYRKKSFIKIFHPLFVLWFFLVDCNIEKNLPFLIGEKI